MAVTAINLARISNNLRAFNLLESVRANQVKLFQVQNSIATGLRFNRPSEDPLRAASAANFDRRLDWMNQVQTNLGKVNGVLTETDSAMQEALDLVSQGQALAVQAVGDTVTVDERHALTTVVDSIVDQLITVGNRRYLNTYLFSGHSDRSPFEAGTDGVTYRGDGNRMETAVDEDQTQDSFTVPGLEFFGAVSSEVRGVADLDPAVSPATRISDLCGALDRGVTLGRIQVASGGRSTEIDLSGAATVKDVVDKLNAGLPAGLTASLGTRFITLTRGGPFVGPITISDVGGGRTAADLGLTGTFGGPSRDGGDLDPRLTGLTRMADLRGGAGVDLSGGLTIQNGARSATVALDDAVTVEDVLNRINQADVGVWARIADDGRSLEVRSRVSGADLFIGENGGRAATSLGLRSMYSGTRLSLLNDGRGVQTAPGDDFQITTADGTSIPVDLDGALTVQDVIDRLNAAGAGAITADFVNNGNGFQITDNTIGGGTLTVAPLNNSFALRDLGLNVTAVGNQLRGSDVNPQRVDGPFSGLLELRRGMAGDDRSLMTTAGERLDRVLKKMQEVQGQMASRAKMMSDRTERVQTETVATQVMLSDVRDVDITEAAVRFQQLQTALQANLSTATKVMNLSLLDYLQ